MESLASVGALAVLDSINPSALVVTLYLLTGDRPGIRIATYTGGIFVTYLALGILLMLGMNTLLDRWNDILWSPTAFAVQGAIGASMLLYSIIADPKSGSQRPQAILGAKGFPLFAAGIVVTVVESTTAAPYLGAIGILAYLDRPAAWWLPVLIVYNLIFIFPPFLLLGLHRLLGAYVEDRFGKMQERLQRAGRETVLWLLGIIGFYLLVDSLAFFDFFGLFELDLPDGIRSPSERFLRRPN